MLPAIKISRSKDSPYDTTCLHPQTIAGLAVIDFQPSFCESWATVDFVGLILLSQSGRRVLQENSLHILIIHLFIDSDLSSSLFTVRPVFDRNNLPRIP
ncbi:hypothetical protein IV203_004980 [Nitzschia inconspicua]|uniref:Uncharacterized protein n=1 Tax=Nitzschia inconspicua TaxID=303405 RepID=A0A9K3PFX7_9STRA|nr:hypothetical protein IV203_004980 [Nitzschia inconspicua]